MTRALARSALLAAMLLLAACDGTQPLIKHEPKQPGPFPEADRPVATIVSARWSTEEARDRLNEASRVMDLAEIRKGMSVADLGAGEGYDTPTDLRYCINSISLTLQPADPAAGA